MGRSSCCRKRYRYAYQQKCQSDYLNIPFSQVNYQRNVCKDRQYSSWSKKSKGKEYKTYRTANTNRKNGGFADICKIFCSPKLSHKRSRAACKAKHQHPMYKKQLGSYSDRRKFGFSNTPDHKIVH